MSEDNPFSTLIPVDSVKKLSNSVSQLSPETSSRQVEAINHIVENVFYFTINANAVEQPNPTGKQLIYLEELAESLKPSTLIDLEALEQALFERLLLRETEAYVIPKNAKVYKEFVTQKKMFPYLFDSMQNLQTYNHNDSLVKHALEKMKELILRNATTALKQPALFEGQDFSEQLFQLLQHVDPQSHTFFSEIMLEMVADGKMFI